MKDAIILCGILAALLLWGAFLPTVGLLWMLGFLK